MDYSDKQLVIDYLNGDKQSLDILIKRYLKPIYSFVCRYVGNSYEAEDIVQQVFIKVWRNLKKFDKEKSFKTWLFQIAKNTSIDFLRKKKAIPFSYFENEKGENMLAEKLADSDSFSNRIFERLDISQILNLAMEKLSPKYRMLLFLRYNDHFTFREIAEALGEPLNTIKSRHRRVLILLKKILDKS